MKKTSEIHDEAKMREEYDFSGAVRGKHYRAYRTGHTVRVHKANGAMDVRHFTQKDGAIMLDPDVKTRFPTSEAVNKALRAVMAHA
jgi:hypothetical protein